MLENYTNQLFETTKKPILIEVLSYSGSAFGATLDGEQVFINKRIVETLNLAEGMTALAYLLPNYADKRATIPWRAMRVELADEVQEPTPEVKKEPEVDPGKLIMKRLKEWPDEYFTTVDLSEDLGLDTKTVNNWCMGLHNKGLIARADVHAAPNQKRASFVLWGHSTKSFAS